MAKIHFEAAPQKIRDWTILRLPEGASASLPSRGLALVEAVINGYHSKIVLEPDGRGSHWFRVDSHLRQAAGIKSTGTLAIAIEPSAEGPEPELPDDIHQALIADPQASALWGKITPMAHWDWLRRIRSTNNPETRRRRITVALSKLVAGERRPCCFNRNLCTEPEVSKNGALIEPTSA